MIKLGFKVKKGRILNLSHIFYNHRDEYCKSLFVADTLRDKDILKWCEYFLKGLKSEIEKIDSLLEIKYIKGKIIKPAIDISKQKEYITKQEHKILRHIIDKESMSITSQELSFLCPLTSKAKSYIIEKMKNKKVIKSINEQNTRTYTINFFNSPILRDVINVLDKEDFNSDFLK